jgi:hypothetical protein
MEEHANKRKIWDKRYSEKRKAARVLARISQTTKPRNAGSTSVFRTSPAPAQQPPQLVLPADGTLEPALPQVMTLVAPPSTSKPRHTIEVHFKYPGGGNNAILDGMTVSVVSKKTGWLTILIDPAVCEDGLLEQDESTWTIRIPLDDSTNCRAMPRAAPRCEQQVLQQEAPSCARCAADAAGPAAQARA